MRVSRPFNKESLQQTVLGKLDIHMQKKKVGPLANTVHKNSPEDLNVRPNKDS